jgi:benzoyl-CoA reductase/2-hydroxyglutaryl-CoA dehydratase subunit BcrC/BadD/HgdB
MEPFTRLFLENARAAELRASDRPVVGMLCNFAPDELILAAGAVPVRLDSGCHVAARRGEDHLPVDVCCGVRAVAGELLSSLGGSPRLDLLVVPTACDGKRKLARVLAERYPVAVLELPFSREGDAARARWRQEIGSLVERLQALTGRRIHRRALREAIERTNRRVGLVREINALRRLEVPPISGLDAFLVMHGAFIADIDWWLARTGELLAELRARAAAGQGRRPRARLLLTGSPVLWPDYKLLRIVHETGADVVIDETCAGTQRFYHPTVVDESTRGGLIRAAAERTLLPCTCPCFSSCQNRLDRLVELVRGWRVEGVVHHTLRLCTPYDVDSAAVSALARTRRVPFLSLHAELGPEETAPLKNRVEALVEMLAASRQGR